MSAVFSRTLSRLNCSRSMAEQQQVLSGEDLNQTSPENSYSAQLILHDARPTGRLLGRGFYGTVKELEMGGLVCTGKELYNVFIAPEDVRRMVDRYYGVCSLFPQCDILILCCFLASASFPSRAAALCCRHVCIHMPVQTSRSNDCSLAWTGFSLHKSVRPSGRGQRTGISARPETT